MQWKPGQSGNPNGRPKGQRLVSYELDKLLQKKAVKIEGKLITRRRAIALMLIEKSLAGDLRATSLLMDYTCSKPIVETANRVTGGINVTVIPPPKVEEQALLGETTSMREQIEMLEGEMKLEADVKELEEGRD